MLLSNNWQQECNDHVSLVQLQKKGDFPLARQDLVEKAAICNVRHYAPVDGTLAWAAAGDSIQFFCMDLNGEVGPMSMVS